MFSFIRFVVIGVAGVFGGMFFAQKSGKRLRKEIGESKHPFQKILKELQEASGESYATVKHWLEHSDEAQSLMKNGKETFKDVSAKVKELGKEAFEEAKNEIKALRKKEGTEGDASKSIKKPKASPEKKFKNKLKDEE
ncbi:MAG TPA: YtxH domain-containing protein [Candidatus Gracilibacteria bacterium]